MGGYFRHIKINLVIEIQRIEKTELNKYGNLICFVCSRLPLLSSWILIYPKEPVEDLLKGLLRETEVWSHILLAPLMNTYGIQSSCNFGSPQQAPHNPYPGDLGVDLYRFAPCPVFQFHTSCHTGSSLPTRSILRHRVTWALRKEVIRQSTPNTIMESMEWWNLTYHKINNCNLFMTT